MSTGTVPIDAKLFCRVIKFCTNNKSPVAPKTVESNATTTGATMGTKRSGNMGGTTVGNINTFIILLVNETMLFCTQGISLHRQRLETKMQTNAA